MYHGMSKTSMWILSGLLAALAAVVAWQPAFAQDGTCLDDVTPGGVTCSANDVGLVEVWNAETLTCMPGEEVELHLRFNLVSTSAERYDIGLFIALDGGDALTGSCHHDYLPPPLAQGGTCSGSHGACRKDADCPVGETCTGGYNPGSPDAGGGPFYNAEPEDALDLCGDLEQGVYTYYDVEPLETIVVPCMDSDGNGLLDVGTAVSWINNKTTTCEDVDDAIPASPSKCRPAIANVGNVYVEPGEIQVTKTADPFELPEPGGMVTFTFTVHNTSAVTITLEDMSDSVYGPLYLWPAGDCAPDVLNPGEVYTCAISAEVDGEPGIHRDTVTVIGGDGWYQAVVSDTATAEVLVVSQAPTIEAAKVADPTTVMEPGGEILYTVTVTNTSGPGDTVLLRSFMDDIYGDLTDPGNPKISDSTCLEDAELGPGQPYTCTFRALVSGVGGDTIVDTVTVTCVDDEGEQAQSSDDATVTIIAEPPETGAGLPAAVVAGGATAVGLVLLLLGALVRRRID